MGLTRTGKDLTKQQGDYLRRLIDGLSPEGAAKRAGYEMPVFEYVWINLYKSCNGYRVTKGSGRERIGTTRWLLPKTVEVDDDRS